MKRFLFVAISLFIWLGALAQESKQLINIDQASFRPEQKGVLETVNIDPIAKDRSQRACARIKLHVNRMTREEIDQLQVVIAGGNVALTKKVTSFEGNGLIIEMTAKPGTRFHIHHDKYGDSNQVTVDLEGDKVYLLNAQLDMLLPITVASNMKGADVYIDNRYCNKTNDNYVLIVQDITPGEHTLRIEHAGRRVEQKILVHRDNLYFRCDVDVAEARPQFVLFELEPKNAVVMIDGEVQSTQEGFVQALLPNGAHNYRIMAKGYHEQSGSFTVDGAKVTRKFVLKADAAMVTITAGGEGAEIWVNNERKGTSPWRGQLLSGNYLFEARKAGHRTTSLPQSITSNPAEQSYTLDAPTPIVGSVTITSVPAMADVYIDGKSVGQTPILKDLVIGKYTVTLRKNGYKSSSIDIVINENKTVKKEIALVYDKTPTKHYSMNNSKWRYNTNKIRANKSSRNSYSKGAFNVGLSVDIAAMGIDGTTRDIDEIHGTYFGMGLGVLWRLWRYNSIIIPMVGARYMYGFSGNHSIGFPLSINFNWCSIGHDDSFGAYSGIGVEPSFISYYAIDWDKYCVIRLRQWDYPLIINLIGFSGRHHDFNIYLNIPLFNNDNFMGGARYTYLF